MKLTIATMIGIADQTGISPRLSVRRLLPLAALLVYGLTFGLLYSTGLEHPYDKVQHLVFFGLLTLALASVFRLPLFMAAATTIVLGAFGEGLQALLPHHEASLFDAAANSLGALSAAGVTALLRSEVAIADLQGHKQEAIQADPGQPASVGSFVSASASSEK